MLDDLEVDEGRIGEPRSQAGLAYWTIRGDIMSGIYRPNQKLKVQEIAAALAVSPGAVREALSRLVPEQLVVVREGRGFAVAPLSFADLEDLTDLRCEIEELALRRSIARGDLDWEGRVVSAAHRLNATPARQADGSINPDWARAHADFHRALVSAAGSKRLLAFHASLFEQSERYRILSANFETDRDVAGEHRQIVELALARNADELAAAMRSHLRATSDLILRAAKRGDL